MKAETLRGLAEGLGAALCGVADLALAEGLETTPEDLFAGYSRAVMVGVGLRDEVIEECLEGPTLAYERHYHAVNAELDRIAQALARELEAAGHRALALPASQLVDKEALTGHVSYKALGRLAGLGWQGKSLLLVNPRLGPRFRLVAVLTDAPLPPDAPIANRCGTCDRCREACPAGAIKGVATETHYRDRDEALDFALCARKCLEDFARRPGMTKPVCGVCIRVCPHGGKRGGTRGQGLEEGVR